MKSCLLVLSTFPDVETARRIARVLVEERLAACGNVLPGLESIYHWQGKVETAQETLVLFKTTQAAYPALEARLKALHPYEVPEILALPPTAGWPPYLAWVGEAIRPPATGG